MFIYNAAFILLTVMLGHEINGENKGYNVNFATFLKIPNKENC